MSAGNAQSAGSPGDNAQIWGELGARPSCVTARGERTGPALAVAPTGLGEHEGKKSPSPSRRGGFEGDAEWPRGQCAPRAGNNAHVSGSRFPTLRDLRDSERVSRIGGPGRDSAYCGNRDQLQNSTLLGGHVEGGSQRLQAASACPPAGDTGIRVCSATPSPLPPPGGIVISKAAGLGGAPRKPQADAGVGVGFLVEPKENSPPEGRRTLPSRQSLGQDKQRHTLGTPAPSCGEVGVTICMGVRKPSCVFHKGSKFWGTQAGTQDRKPASFSISVLRKTSVSLFFLRKEKSDLAPLGSLCTWGPWGNTPYAWGLCEIAGACVLWKLVSSWGVCGTQVFSAWDPARFSSVPWGPRNLASVSGDLGGGHTDRRLINQCSIKAQLFCEKKKSQFLFEGWDWVSPGKC